MKVITLSKQFLKGHPRAGSPTGFREKFLMGEKVHTIRKNERGYFKDGEGLSVREWSGAAYRSKQVEICALKSCGVVPIRLYRGFGLVDIFDSHPDSPVVVPINVLAANDGLSVSDFLSWFFSSGAEEFFYGSLIYLTDYRY